MKFINFTVVRLAGCLTAGIVLAYFVPEAWKPLAKPSVFFLILTPVVLALFITWLLERSRLRQGIFFGALTYFCFFLIGFSNYQLRSPEHHKRHFVHFSSSTDCQLIQLKITEVLSENPYSQRYEAEVLQLDSHQVKGTILLSIKKDADGPNLAVDTRLLVSGVLSEIYPPLNPHQFNYKKYLENQGIYRQLKTSSPSILMVNKGSSTLRGLSEQIRNHSIDKLSKTAIKPKQRAVLQALVLGHKKDIDEEQYRAFAAAGALHILAVSGLHVGILFLVFTQLLSPLLHVKFGKQIRAVIVVLLLWAFAVLAGLSPSVVRSVTMFSFFALAGMLERPTNGFNTLYLSYFVLLLFEPSWLFHVGFQLSYLAVFHILWIQPRLYKLYIPKYYLDKLIWGICTVTLAAQIGVAPLSMFYFHQFPGLFFLTNLVILPFLSLILMGGLAVVLLTVLNLLPESFAIAYDWVLEQLNNFVNWVAQKELFLFEEISFSFLTMFICYFFLIVLILWWMNKSSKRLIRIFIAGTLWLGVVISENKKVEKEQLVIFHGFGKTYIGYQKDRDFTLYHSDTLAPFTNYPLRSFMIERRVSNYTSEKIPKVFRYKNKWILRLDSIGVYPKLENPIVLLSHNSKVHMNRLIDSLQPAKIIVDGSNYPWVVKRWKATCLNRNVPFHYTGKQGAFVF